MGLKLQELFSGRILYEKFIKIKNFKWQIFQSFIPLIEHLSKKEDNEEVMLAQGRMRPSLVIVRVTVDPQHRKWKSNATTKKNGEKS